VRKHIALRGEKEAWRQLRLLRVEGFAFRREHKLGRYWADFVCLRKRLIVEVDGPLHDSREAQAHDAKRDDWLRAERFVVLRFTEAEILSSSYWLGEVRDVLSRQTDSPYRHKKSRHPLPPPPLGEGEQSAS
jgi:5-methyltetrahydrofolate--homocysteine methyltransferase